MSAKYCSLCRGIEQRNEGKVVLEGLAEGKNFLGQSCEISK